MVLTEGWDMPDCGCLILARPTKKMGLYRQMVGRVLRPADGKPDAIVLDHSGAVFRHGFVEDHVEWTLDPDKRSASAVHSKRLAAGHASRILECGDEEGLPYLRFGPDANDRFVEWRTDLEKRLRSGELHPALESHLAKYRKLVPGLALICHLADGGTKFVGLPALERALAARRAYGSATAVSATTAKAIVAKIRSGDLKCEFRSHEVWRPGWSKLTDSDAVRAALEMLVDYDWLRVRKLETGGRPAFIYIVNPKILNA